MRRERILGLANWVCWTACSWGVCAANGPSVDTIVDGVIARSNEIYGVKVEYGYEGSVRQQGRTLQSEERDLALTVFGDDWVLRQTRTQNFRMCRDQTSLNYYVAGSEQDQIDRSLHIQEAKSLEDLIHEHASHAVTRLGTFWFEPQSRYVDRHRKQIRRQATETIDGLSCHVVEWTVEATDFDEAMIVIPRPIAVAGAGVLRIYACEQLNWALPRIEYCLLDGQVKRRFQAWDFTRVSDGVFFPRRAASQRLMGNRKDVSEFHVRRVSLLNSKLPKSEFALQVPAQTRVRDARPGMATAVFSLQEPGQLDNLLRNLGQSSASSAALNRRRLLLLVINAAFVLTFTGYWVFRRCRS